MSICAATRAQNLAEMTYKYLSILEHIYLEKPEDFNEFSITKPWACSAITHLFKFDSIVLVIE